MIVIFNGLCNWNGVFRLVLKWILFKKEYYNIFFLIFILYVFNIIGVYIYRFILY